MNLWKKIAAWAVPDGAFWSYKDELHVFYEKQWIEVEIGRRLDYMRVYGVLWH